jgi:large subunit ribosomal protein L21
MYAIVKTGGKQYRVEPGQKLLVERLSADVGATVSLEPVLYRAEKVAFDEASLAGVRVNAKVLAHERGPKLRVFKFKPKRGYKRRTGHRQELTRIEVAEITAGGSSRARAGTQARSSHAKPAAAGRTAAPSRPRATRPGAAAAGEKAAETPARGAKRTKEDDGGT